MEHAVRSNPELGEHKSRWAVTMEDDDSDRKWRVLPLSCESTFKMHCSQNQGWPVRAHHDDGCVRVRQPAPRDLRRRLVDQTVW